MVNRTAPKRHPDIRWKRTGRTGILLNLMTGDYFELDEYGMAIWNRIDGRTPAAEIAGALARAYAARPAPIARDVTAFLSLLKKKQLVTVQPP